MKTKNADVSDLRNDDSINLLVFESSHDVLCLDEVSAACFKTVEMMRGVLAPPFRNLGGVSKKPIRGRAKRVWFRF